MWRTRIADPRKHLLATLQSQLAEQEREATHLRATMLEERAAKDEMAAEVATLRSGLTESEVIRIGYRRMCAVL